MKMILNRLIPLRLALLVAMVGCIVYGLGHRDAGLRRIPGFSHLSLQADMSAKMAVWTLSLERQRSASAAGLAKGSEVGGATDVRSAVDVKGTTDGSGATGAGISGPTANRAPSGPVEAAVASQTSRSRQTAGPMFQKAEDELMALGTADGRRCAAALDLYQGEPLRREIFHPLIRESPSEGEAQVWMAVADAAHLGAAGAHLSPTAARKIQALAGSWKLGWYHTVLLAAVLRLAKDGAAARYQSEAVNAAARFAALIIGIGAGVLLITVAGIILLIVAAVRWRDLPRIASPLMDVPALPLIEGACFWVWIMVFASHYALSGVGDISADAGLLLELVVELVVGCGCILLTGMWLKTNGFAVAFPAWRGVRRYLRDAAWGVGGYLILAPMMVCAALLSVRVFGTGDIPKAPPTPLPAQSATRGGSRGEAPGTLGKGSSAAGTSAGGATAGGVPGEGKAEGRTDGEESEQGRGILPSQTPDNPAAVMMARLHRPEQLAMIFVLAVFLAPIFEERFFRGALYPALRTRLPMWAAAAITGAVFAGIHPQLPLGFAPIFVLGTGFCVLYELRGTTAASVTAHALNNALVFAVVVALTAR